MEMFKDEKNIKKTNKKYDVFMKCVKVIELNNSHENRKNENVKQIQN